MMRSEGNSSYCAPTVSRAGESSATFLPSAYLSSMLMFSALRLLADLFFRRMRVLNSYLAARFRRPALKSTPMIGAMPQPVWSQLSSMS